MYLTDTRAVRNPMSGDYGRLHFDGVSAWAVDALTIQNGWIAFPDGFDLTVTNMLRVSGSARCDVRESAVDCGGDLVVSNSSSFYAYRGTNSEERLTVGGDLVADSSSLYVYYALTNPASLSIGGNLIIENGSACYLYAGATNGVDVQYGGLVDLSGRDLTVADASDVYLKSEPYTGGSILMRVRDLTVESNATINCDGRGFAGGDAGHPIGYGPGGSVSQVRSGGAGHGGRGGDSAQASAPGGPTNDVETAPLLPGSGSGAKNLGVNDAGAYGGGLVWVEAGGALPSARPGETGTVFVAIDPNAPRIDNKPEANVGGTTADLVGELTSTGSAATTVMVFWGTSNGMYSPAAWDSNAVVATGASVGWFTNSVTDLQAATLYYYRFYATNAAGHDWGEPAEFFTTSGAPDVDNDGGATDITLTSALLRGVAQGTPHPTVTIYWGTSNGLSEPLAWEHDIDIGLVTNLSFEGTATGLVANQAYFYRCFATNINGGKWATSATNFQTASPDVSAADVSVTEGDSGSTDAVFVVSLTAASAIDVSVGFTTSNGAAVAGSDYTQTGGVLVITAGATSGIVNVPVTGDVIDEYPSQAFFLQLTSAVNASLARDLATGTIVDDDPVAGTMTWTGVGTWDSVPNWSPPGESIPDSSDTVIIPGATTCTLTGAGRADEVTLSGILVFSGPGAVLEAADVVVAATGVMQHDIQTATDTNALGQWEIDNAITIVCTNFTVLAGGKLDGDRKGFKGGTISHRAGYGPGGGEYGSTRGGGGSYGGRGGKGNDTARSQTYGDMTAPVDPGSGGGSKIGETSGGHGGGCVRIAAGGHVAVSGTVTAGGGPGTGDSGGGGSGGGVYISCRTFAGTNGRVSAAGGKGAALGGGGGGGRIAVTYDAGAQQALGVLAGVQLSSRHGDGGSLGQDGDLGTVYMTDTLVLPHQMLGTDGRLAFDSVSAWSPDALEVNNGWVIFPDGFELAVTGGVAVVDDGRLDVSNSIVSCGGSLVVSNGSSVYAYRGTTSREKFIIGGDLDFNDATLSYSYGLTNPATLSIAGNMTLNNGSTCYLYSGVTNGTGRDYGGLLDLAGRDLTVAPASRLYLASHAIDGGSMLVRVASLDIASGGVIIGDGMGFDGGRTGHVVGYGPGGGGSAVRGGGGGYGGRGGNAQDGAAGGVTNGSALMPLLPGSGGGAKDGGVADGSPGGSLVRIEAFRTVTVDGTVTTAGSAGTGDSAGGGAGGGIYITCRTIGGGGALTAGGGNGTTYGGGGGGGRIAVWMTTSNFVGTTSVNGGGGWSSGSVGTVVWKRVAPAGTLFLLR